MTFNKDTAIKKSTTAYFVGFVMLATFSILVPMTVSANWGDYGDGCCADFNEGGTFADNSFNEGGYYSDFNEGGSYSDFNEGGYYSDFNEGGTFADNSFNEGGYYSDFNEGGSYSDFNEGGYYSDFNEGGTFADNSFNEGGYYSDFNEGGYYSDGGTSPDGYAYNWDDYGDGCCGTERPTGEWYSVADPVYGTTAPYGYVASAPTRDTGWYFNFSYDDRERPRYYAPRYYGGGGVQNVSNIQTVNRINEINRITEQVRNVEAQVGTIRHAVDTYYRPQNTVVFGQPSVRYAYPSALSGVPVSAGIAQAQPGVTVASRAVDLGSLPYTGTNDIAYILTLIVVALASGGAFFLYRGHVIAAFSGLVPAFANGRRTPEVVYEEVPEEENVEAETESVGEARLALQYDENGPRLSFVRR